jgi:hypothetical protein
LLYTWPLTLTSDLVGRLLGNGPDGEPRECGAAFYASPSPRVGGGGI